MLARMTLPIVARVDRAPQYQRDRCGNAEGPGIFVLLRNESVLVPLINGR